LGVGAGGLTCALLLGKLGITAIEVWDIDEVEPENLGPSLYGWNDVGMSKVDACARLLAENVHLKIEARHESVEDMHEFGDVVFLCVDSNDLKLSLVERMHALGEAAPSRVFEGRMSAQNFLAHSFNPRKQAHVSRWKDFYMPDDDIPAHLPGCGAVRVSLSTIATMAASTLVQQFIDWVLWDTSGQQSSLVNQVYFDRTTFTCEPSSWGE
jgi:molybdopterin/thiamine biosynthesis adenylyltransferase